MSFAVGIVGLPNVGKSTLFSALTRAQVDIANYPFATIEPNKAVVPVPDERLQKLALQEKSEKILPTTIEFVDIAGLVAGASKGEGLGNQFLANIREVDAIIHLIRAFENSDIIRAGHGADRSYSSDKSYSPAEDKKIILTELALADLEYLQKRIETLAKKAKADKDAAETLEFFKKVELGLNNGKLASEILNELDKTYKSDKSYRSYFSELLTAKPFLTVANISDTREEVDIGGEKVLALNAQLEYEISQLAPEEQAEFRKSYLSDASDKSYSGSGLERLTRAAYQALDLITFITAGPMETRAWTVKRGTKAPQAAGKIHTDFERGFIKAEVIDWDKLLEAGGYGPAREKGWIRLEGKDYTVKDGDVVHFKFNI